MTEHDVAHSTSHDAPTAHGNPVEAMPIKELFSRQELAEFNADEVTAGKAIGRMLALFFIYTVIATGGVAWWTYHASTH